MELEPDAPLPFGDSEFDLVLCAETIEHVRDLQLLLSELRRVLRPGGTLAVTTPASRPLMRPPHPLSPHLRFLTRRSLRELLGELGFACARSGAPGRCSPALLDDVGLARPSSRGAAPRARNRACPGRDWSM